MGAGKGHVLQWLSAQSLFPLAAFVTVNPDHLRELLPEVDAYNAIDAGTMGYLTQKEVGYISEVRSFPCVCALVMRVVGMLWGPCCIPWAPGPLRVRETPGGPKRRQEDGLCCGSHQASCLSHCLCCCPPFVLFNPLLITTPSTSLITSSLTLAPPQVLTYDALMKKKNVLVDGSLRDVHWYLEYFRKLRCDFPSLRIAIIHVEASLDIVLSRAHARALQTLRSVPDELIIASVSSIPVSVLRLSSQTDFHVRFNNNQQTVLEYACMHAKQEGCSPETEPNRKILWTLAKEEEGYLLEDDSGKWVQEDWRER